MSSTLRLPSAAGRTTTPSAEAGFTPVSAVMLIWRVTTTSVPGPHQRDKMARACAVCASLISVEVRKEELKAGSSFTTSTNASRAVSCSNHTWHLCQLNVG